MKTQNQPLLSESEQVTLARLSWSLAGKIAAHPGVNLTIATERALLEMPEVVRAYNSHAALVEALTELLGADELPPACSAMERQLSAMADARALLQSLNA